MLDVEENLRQTARNNEHLNNRETARSADRGLGPRVAAPGAGLRVIQLLTAGSGLLDPPATATSLLEGSKGELRELAGARTAWDLQERYPPQGILVRAARPGDCNQQGCRVCLTRGRGSLTKAAALPRVHPGRQRRTRARGVARWLGVTVSGSCQRHHDHS